MGKLIGFSNWQCIHVSAQTNRSGLISLSKDANNPCLTYLPVNLDSELLKLTRNKI